MLLETVRCFIGGARGNRRVEQTVYRLTRLAGTSLVCLSCREGRSEAEELVALRVQQAGLGTGEWRMELVDSGLWISGLRAGLGAKGELVTGLLYGLRGSPLHTRLSARHLARAVRNVD